MSEPEEQDDREHTARIYPEERRSERLPPREGDGDSEPYNPTWRSQRLNRNTTRRSMGGLPTSPQEISVWLQGGGWRWLAAVAAILVLLLILSLALRNPRRTTQTAEGLSATSAVVSATDSPLLLQATVTTPPQPTTPPAPAAFTVTGTESQGLLLRSDHSTNAEALETLPDGTRVERIGEDFTGSDHVWRNVRSPSGKEGWVAADYLQAAQ